MRRSFDRIVTQLVGLSLLLLLVQCRQNPTVPTEIPLITEEVVVPSPSAPPSPSPLPLKTPGENDYAAFLEAVQQGNAAVVRTCIDQGYDVNWQDNYGLSLLNYAADQGNLEIVQGLVAAGADVNYADPWGMTSLHAALKSGHDAVVQDLLAHGAAVNVATTSGTYRKFTPLHTAVYFGTVQLDTLELLLQNGADVTPKDAQGRTALQIAEAQGWDEAAALLREYGAGSP